MIMRKEHKKLCGLCIVWNSIMQKKKKEFCYKLLCASIRRGSFKELQKIKNTLIKVNSFDKQFKGIKTENSKHSPNSTSTQI